MSWSWKVGRLFGIPVYLHATFLLLMGFILLAQWRAGGNLVAAIVAVLFILAIFATIVLHELGSSGRGRCRVQTAVGRARPLPRCPPSAGSR